MTARPEAVDELGERIQEVLGGADLMPTRRSPTGACTLTEVDVLALRALMDIRERLKALEEARVRGGGSYPTYEVANTTSGGIPSGPQTEGGKG